MLTRLVIGDFALMAATGGIASAGNTPYVVILWPLVLSFFAGYYLATGDIGLLGKLCIWGLVIGAVAMQIVPPLRDAVHFLVPLFMQLFVCIWACFAWKLEELNL